MKAGIWDLQASIHEDFNLGSMLPQVTWAKHNNFGILIMNPNEIIAGESPNSS